jgi:glutathione S-transferase
LSDLTLYIGNKNYSSWSLRPWLALKQASLAFQEEIIPLDQPGTRDAILQHSPTGRLPCLVATGEATDSLVIWDSLAICDYAAEIAKVPLWPADPQARAVARSVSAEMHAGFPALRQHLPMNLRRPPAPRSLSPSVQAEVNRVTAIWRDCRRRFAGHKSLLFGDFSIADAMYAPVVTRFLTYAVTVDDDARDYMEAVMALPALQEWVEAAKAETWVIPADEVQD